MLALYGLFYLLSGWVIFQLVYPFGTVALARLFGRERVAAPSGAGVPHDFACIITAYRNAAIARPLVESLLRQTHERQVIYLVADECEAIDFELRDERFVLLRPDPPLRLKAKSIIHAIANFRRPHDYTVVFDADNLAHPRFLETLDRYAAAGHRCIQGRRTAKNLDSQLAAADSLGETYKNYIERYAPYLLGGSAVISGSGMATETALYREYLASPEIEKGQHLWKKMLQEDKILQNFLLRRDIPIAYAWDAVCYDEKVETAEAVRTQRSRWLYSYFQNIPNALGILRRGLLRGSANQFFFGLTTLALPMFIQVGLALLLAVAGWLLAPAVSLTLLGALLIFAGNVLWVLRLSGAPAAVWKAIGAVPGFVWRQVLGLFGMRNPNKNFKHSEHRHALTMDDLRVHGLDDPEP